MKSKLDVDNLKKLIKVIIIDKYQTENKIIYEITDIRKNDINNKTKFITESCFYNELELDQIIYIICKTFNLKTYIIRNKYFNNKVIYIIDNMFIYNTKFHLTENQIKNLIIEFNSNKKNNSNDDFINNFLFLKKHYIENNIPVIKYLDINEIKNN